MRTMLMLQAWPVLHQACDVLPQNSYLHYMFCRCCRLGQCFLKPAHAAAAVGKATSSLPALDGFRPLSVSTTAVAASRRLRGLAEAKTNKLQPVHNPEAEGVLVLNLQQWKAAPHTVCPVVLVSSRASQEQ